MYNSRENRTDNVDETQPLQISAGGAGPSLIETVIGAIGTVIGALIRAGSRVGYWFRQPFETERIEKILETIDSEKLNTFKEIGRETMEVVVYKAKYYGIDVAVKQLCIILVDSNLFELFNQEVTLMKKLRHQCLVNYYGYYQDPIHYSIVMEYVPGRELSKVLRDKRAEFEWFPTRMQIAEDVASAVSFLHNNHIIHGDLRSQNVLVYYEDTFWGGTHIRAKVAMATMTKGMGTPLWMAPEVIEAQGERRKITYDEKVDVYSYGIILSELINREQPFSEIKTYLEVTSLVLRGERPEVVRNAPSGFINLMKRCWTQRAVDRPEMKEVVNTLNQIEPAPCWF
jgi:serine/threonine protein kinase